MQMLSSVQRSSHRLFSNWAATVEKQAVRRKPQRGFVPKPKKEDALTCHANEWKYKHNNIRGQRKKKTDEKDSYKICHTCSTFLQILK